MCRSSLMRHDLIGLVRSAFGTRSSVSRADFPQFHMVFLGTPLHVDAVTDESKLPWHKYLKGE
jgi:hypothetical protein